MNKFFIATFKVKALTERDILLEELLIFAGTLVMVRGEISKLLYAISFNFLELVTCTMISCFML